MRKYILITLFLFMLSICSLKIEVQAEELANIGVVVRDTQMYTAANNMAVSMGSIGKGIRVEIISVLSHFIIIKHSDIYAYLPYSDVQLDTDFEKQFGHQIPYISPYELLVTEGRIYEQAAEIMIKGYLKVP